MACVAARHSRALFRGATRISFSPACTRSEGRPRALGGSEALSFAIQLAMINGRVDSLHPTINSGQNVNFTVVFTLILCVVVSFRFRLSGLNSASKRTTSHRHSTRFDTPPRRVTHRTRNKYNENEYHPKQQRSTDVCSSHSNTHIYTFKQTNCKYITTHDASLTCSIPNCY